MKLHSFFNWKLILPLLAGLWAGLSGLVAQSETPPNVIMILVDDQGYYDLGCYGATEVETPRIDGMAAAGVRFTDYYAAAPICSPSRAGLLTGMYPRRTGNEIWVHRPDAVDGIPPSTLTIAELFRDAGYATACIGKWHLGFKAQYLPRSQGFDYYFGILHNLDSFEVGQFEGTPGIPLLRNEEVLEYNVAPGRLTELYTDEAIAWIEQVRSAPGADETQPFFIYLPHTMLHIPMGVSEPFAGSSNWGLYGDAIQEMDHNVGRLLDTLDHLGIADNTIVVYLSDNGRGPGRNADQPISGSKLTTYEGGLRVPGIVAGGPVRRGLESGVLAHAMDWYPTLASLAGIKIPEDITLDGRDLSALLKGETDDIPSFDAKVSLNAEIPLRRMFEPDREWSDLFTREDYVNAFFYHGSHGALAAVRHGPWKLWLNPGLSLFNLADDPGETTPLPDSTKPGGQSEYSPEDVQRLKRELRGLVIQFQREMNQATR